ncbi:MAG: DUF2225 domain-containing protein [Defluviitaleaceae bacterium]|nr:DUF2225 domain-containing protein [Defluviitaleaceae bacterium]
MDKQKKTVFIVDDVLTNLIVGKKVLEKQYNVFTFNAGQRLLDMLDNLHPDLILLDISMPEMDGFETLTRLKANEKTANIPVVFLSAITDKDTMMVARHYGVSDYITKPFQPVDLLLRVENQIKLMELAPMSAASVPAASVPVAPVSAPAASVAPISAPAAPVLVASTSDAPAGLLPEGHKKYDLQIPVPNEGLLYERKITCPLCGVVFMGNAVRSTKLKLIQREKDFRNRHDGIDTVYYEINTCPSCCYSNFDTSFKDVVLPRFEKNKAEISPYIGQINGVFEKYYMALKCQALFFAHSEVNTAKLWTRLMWLYQDCPDEEMELFAAKNAQTSYLDAFVKTELSAEAIQQICVIVGELSLRLNDIPTAKTYFTQARSHRSGSRALISQAEDGIETIRKMEQKG